MRKKLGEILVERGVFSPEYLDTAIRRQSTIGNRLGEILAQMGTARWDIEAALYDQREMARHGTPGGSGLHWWDRVNMQR
jgi:hypothetical protein